MLWVSRLIVAIKDMRLEIFFDVLDLTLWHDVDDEKGLVVMKQHNGNPL